MTTRFLAVAAMALAPLLASPSQAMPVSSQAVSSDILRVADGCGPGYRIGRDGQCRPQRYRSWDHDLGNGYKLHYECPRGFRYSNRTGRCRPFGY
jgi:hypothetical protein